MADILMAFGFIWITNGTFVGLYMGAKHEAHVDRLVHLIKDNKLVEYEKTRGAWQWKSVVHAHGSLLSLVAIAVAHVMPMMHYNHTALVVMTSLFIVAPIIWSIFGWWFFKPLLAIGDLCFAAGMVMAVIGLPK